MISQKIELLVKIIGIINSWGMDISMWSEVMKIIQKIANIGREAVIVYSIRYILACTRSGWYPQVIIIIIVGIRDASNQI